LRRSNSDVDHDEKEEFMQNHQIVGRVKHPMKNGISFALSFMIGLALVITITTPASAQQNVVYESKSDQTFVFETGSDGHLHDKHLSGGSWGWEDQGLPPTTNSVAGPVAVYQTTMDRIYVFVLGNDGQLYDKYWDGQLWSQWESQGMPPGKSGVVTGPTAVYRSASDRIYLFVEGGDGQLYDKYWDGQQWSQWESRGVPPPGGPFGTLSGLSAVYQPTLDRIFVFGVGVDLHLWDNHWDGQANNWQWQDHGLSPSSTKGFATLSAIYRSKLDRIYLFAEVGGSPGMRNVDGDLWDIYWDGQQWTAWEAQGIPQGTTGLFTLSAVCAAYQPTLDQIHVFVTGTDGLTFANLYDRHWDGSQWVWDNHGLPSGTKWVNTSGAVYWPKSDRITVFALGYETGTDAQLYDNYWNGQQWAWENQGPLAMVFSGPNAKNQMGSPDAYHSTITVAGSGFQPGETLQIVFRGLPDTIPEVCAVCSALYSHLDDVPAPTLAQVGADGTFQVAEVVPHNIESGTASGPVAILVKSTAAPEVVKAIGTMDASYWIGPMPADF
jgi:hypothetical protein